MKNPPLFPPRNDVPAALAYVQKWLDAGERPPGEKVAILLQLQDDDTELLDELRKLLP